MATPNLSIDLVLSKEKKGKGPEDLLLALKDNVSCLCFFGGDPSSQASFAIEVSQEILKRTQGRIFRIYWEINGLFSPKLLLKVIELTLISGGVIKFDLKAWSSEIHYALTRFYPEGIRDRKERKLPYSQQARFLCQDIWKLKSIQIYPMDFLPFPHNSTRKIFLS